MYDKPMPLNRRLADDIPVHAKASADPDVFGIEIELEGRKIKTTNPNVLYYWDVHNDNSLRVQLPGAEATEYVFKSPLSMPETDVALKILLSHLNSPGVEVFKSYRTSTHVHVSYALETMRTIYNSMVLSVIFDELLVSQNGTHRIGNNFCLRAKDAHGQINEIVHSTKEFGNFYHVNGNHRYSSINFVSLMKFGSIEYRSLECTTDLDRIRHWIDTLHRIRVVSRSFDDPKDIIGYFSRMSTKEFLYFVLGPCAQKYEQVKGYESMLMDGMRLAQDLAYCSKWILREKDEKKEQQPKRFQKKLIPGGAGPVANAIQQWAQAQIEVGNFHQPHAVWDMPAPPHQVIDIEGDGLMEEDD